MMSDKIGPMNYYKHHLGDYDGHTSHLSWLEDAAYRRLICLYYRTEKPLPRDVAAVARLVRAQSRQELRAVDAVLEEFFNLDQDGWHNNRCDGEVAKYQEKASKNRESGRKGGRPPKEETQTVSENNPDGSQNETEPEPKDNPSHYPLATSHYPIKKEDDVDDTRDPIQVAMDAVFDACGRSPNLVNLGRVRAWLDDGCDLDLDILPSIASCLAKKPPGWAPNNLKYFDRPVADAKASRLAPMPEGNPDGNFPDLPQFLDRRPKPADAGFITELADALVRIESRAGIRR